MAQYVGYTGMKIYHINFITWARKRKNTAPYKFLIFTIKKKNLGRKKKKKKKKNCC